MSAVDPIAGILAGLERPVSPRAEFAESLLGRLLEELGPGPSPAQARRRLRLPRLLPVAPPRLRLALVVIALLLLLAGIATATYFGVREWVSTGPRGIQYTNDFTLVELAGDVDYGNLTLAHSGDELYGISAPYDDLEKAAIVRISGLRGDRAESEVVLRLADLKDPALWDPGADLSEPVSPEIFVVPEFAPGPSVAENGDLAFVAAVGQGRRKSTALFVRHADGEVEKVLTLRELVDAGLLDPAAVLPQNGLLLGVAFSSPDRLFFHVNDGPGLNRVSRFLEVVDPNADGDWADREVAELELPAELDRLDRPFPDPRKAWYVNKLLAEPSVGGDDRSRSFLLALSGFGQGEKRVYRVSDANGDADALDEGELELLFRGMPNSSETTDVVAPRLVVQDGDVTLRELLVGGYTTMTRVSRISEDGEVIDIARGFFRIGDVAADTDGNIYVLGLLPNADATGLIKLKPVPAGASSAAGAQATTAAAETTRTATTPTAPPKLQRIAVGRYGVADAEFFLLGANGRRLGTLFQPGDSGWLELVSPSGRSFVYRADTEIPRELFSYVGHTDGRKATKLADKEVFVLCWLSERSLATNDPVDEGFDVLSRDLRTGRTKTLVRNTSPIGCSADGSSILLQSLRGGSEGPLELFDVRSGNRRRLFTQSLPSNSAFGDKTLSPDGRYVAYTIQHSLTMDDRANGRVTSYDVYVLDAATREPKLVHSAKTELVGGAYPLWSPTSERLLLSISRPRAKPCTADELSRASGSECQRWDLAFVDAQSGAVTRVASLLRDVPDVFWAPDGERLAYTIGNGVFIVDTSGKPRKLPKTAGYRLFGWSPDGRYLGLTRGSPFWINGKETRREIAVLELATGKVRTVFETKAEWLAPTWWR